MTKPTFLLDENIPFSVYHALKHRGYRVFHAKKEWKGSSDKFLSKLAEKYKYVVVTRDKGFPEPVLAGDRVIVVDLPSITAVDEVLTRLKDLGW